MPTTQSLRSTPIVIQLEKALDALSASGARQLAIDGVEIQLHDGAGIWRRSAQGPRGWMPTCCLAFGLPLPGPGQIVEVLAPRRDPRFSHWARSPAAPEFQFFAATQISDRSERCLGVLCITGTSERAALSQDERRVLLDLAESSADAVLSRRAQVDRLFPAPDAALAAPVWSAEEWIAGCLPATA